MIINTLIVKNYFDDHCSYCFIFPLIKLKDLFKEIGIKINFFFKISKNIFDCDVLLIESRYFERLKNSTFDELSLENFLSNILFLWAQLSNKKIDQGLETYKNISDYYNNLKKLQFHDHILF